MRFSVGRVSSASRGRPAGPEHARRRSRAHLAPVIAAALLAGSCESAGILDPRGPVASAQRLLLFDSTAIMLVVVLPVIVATLAFAWWYRASNPHAVRSEELAYEGRIEFVVWSIPALTVMLLGGVIWLGSHQLDPRAPLAAKADPLKVDVVALDWKWLFIYPDQGVASVNELTVPVGPPFNLRITSATVMNSFFVPQLGSQIYAMGGMTTRLNLLASEPGEYPGISANFSGQDFSRMRFLVKAVPAGDFDAWLAGVRGKGSALDEAAFAELAKPGTAEPTTYGSVTPKLFERIVERTATAPAEASTRAGTGASAGTAWCATSPREER